MGGTDFKWGPGTTGPPAGDGPGVEDHSSKAGCAQVFDTLLDIGKSEKIHV